MSSHSHKKGSSSSGQHGSSSSHHGSQHGKGKSTQAYDPRGDGVPDDMRAPSGRKWNTVYHKLTGKEPRMPTMPPIPESPPLEPRTYRPPPPPVSSWDRDLTPRPSHRDRDAQGSSYRDRDLTPRPPSHRGRDPAPRAQASSSYASPFPPEDWQPGAATSTGYSWYEPPAKKSRTDDMDLSIVRRDFAMPSGSQSSSSSSSKKKGDRGAARYA